MVTEFAVNHWYIILCICTFSVNGLCVAWTTGGYNQSASIFAAKLDWTGAQAQDYNSLINFSSQIGKAIGALLGGLLISKGRNKVFICFNILALLSCLSMQYINVWVLAAGKFFNGIFVTIVHIAQIKMINEIVPVYHLGKYGSAVQIMGSSGYLIMFSIGNSGLPKSEYDPDLDHTVYGAANTLAYIDAKNDNFWRVIFIVPLFINALMITSFLLFI